MTPEHERYCADDQPNSSLEPSAFAKKKDKKRAAEKNRAPERIKANEGKMWIIIETFEQAFLHVPGDRVD